MNERQTISKKRVIYSPMTGRSAPITEACDQAFAEKMIGDGAMITPAEKTVVSPCDGTVLFVSGTKHAIGLKTEEGIGLLLHVGIDTAALNGEGFNVWVESGQTVKKGDILMELDLDFLEKNAKSMDAFITVTDTDRSKTKISLIASGEVRAGEPLYWVTIYE